MIYKDLLTILLERQDLPRDAMLAAMHALMGGEYTPAQIAGFLVAMRMKGETVTEIAAAAEVMRELSIKVPLADVPYLVDTCGTGGDGAHTFNISTAAVFVAAACGAHVAKHGGRSVSSSSGSADVLEALGANVSLTPEKLAEAVRTIGVGFVFAPSPRRVTPAAARALMRGAAEVAMASSAGASSPGLPLAVGVFGDTSAEEIARVVEEVGPGPERSDPSLRCLKGTVQGIHEHPAHEVENPDGDAVTPDAPARHDDAVARHGFFLGRWFAV